MEQGLKAGLEGSHCGMRSGCTEKRDMLLEDLDLNLKYSRMWSGRWVGQERQCRRHRRSSLLHNLKIRCLFCGAQFHERWEPLAALVPIWLRT